jgi:hypothetical protein
VVVVVVEGYEQRGRSWDEHETNARSLHMAFL